MIPLILLICLARGSVNADVWRVTLNGCSSSEIAARCDTTVTYATFEVLMSDCISHLEQPCTVEVLEAELTAPRGIACEDPIHFLVPLPEVMSNFESFKVAGMDPDVYRQASGNGCTDAAVQAVPEAAFDELCAVDDHTLLGDASTFVTTGRNVTFVDPAPSVNLNFGAHKSLYMYMGQAAGCIAAFGDELPVVNVNGQLKPSLVPGGANPNPSNFIVAVKGCDATNPCQGPFQILNEVFECVKAIPNDCLASVSGIVEPQEPAELCEGKFSTAYFEDTDGIFDLAENIAFTEVTTGLYYSKTVDETCLSARNFVAVPETDWVDTKCDNIPVGTSIGALFADADSNMKVRYGEEPEHRIAGSPMHRGFVLSAGPQTVACEVVPAMNPQVRYKFIGDVRVSNLKPGAAGPTVTACVILSVVMAFKFWL